MRLGREIEEGREAEWRGGGTAPRAHHGRESDILSDGREWLCV